MFGGYYDYRSDTITHPTEAMKAAMAEAPLGDDGREGDPTTAKLQSLAAEILGKEAALFLPSVTMANLIALLLHGRPGSQVLMEADSHVYTSEFGGIGAVAGLVAKAIPGAGGTFDAEALSAAIADSFDPGLVWIENTHNMSGGAVWTVESTERVAEVCRGRPLPLHMDGARLFNASIATGASPRALAAGVDTVSLCLSKGLSCPFGGLLVGAHEVIEEARKFRRRLGGSLRQSGIAAAAGIVALTSGVERLRDDHARAIELVEALEGIEGLRVVRQPYQTNIVNVDVSGTGYTVAEFAARLESHRVLVLPRPPRALRIVTHRHVAPEDIGPTIAAFEKAARPA